MNYAPDVVLIARSVDLHAVIVLRLPRMTYTVLQTKEQKPILNMHFEKRDTLLKSNLQASLYDRIKTPAGKKKNPKHSMQKENDHLLLSAFFPSFPVPSKNITKSHITHV